MQDEEQILQQLKELGNTNDKKAVTLASLKIQKSAIQSRDVDLKTIVNPRPLNETLKSESIKIYFCSLCGRKALGANIGLDSMLTRRSDNSIAINMTQIFMQNFLKKQGIKYIKRSNGQIEKQYRWCCEECDVHIAYQCITYEESSEIIKGNQTSKLTNKPYLYVLNDAIVINQQFSKLHSEIEKLKDQLEYENKQ